MRISSEVFAPRADVVTVLVFQILPFLLQIVALCGINAVVLSFFYRPAVAFRTPLSLQKHLTQDEGERGAGPAAPVLAIATLNSCYRNVNLEPTVYQPCALCRPDEWEAYEEYIEPRIQG